jgi:hypothetical protein
MAKENKKLKAERKEAWMRIPIGIFSGIILYVWAYLICLFFVINIIYRIFSGKTLKELSSMSEVWNIQNYHFLKYMIFQTDERPFPFTDFKKNK